MASAGRVEGRWPALARTHQIHYHRAPGLSGVPAWTAVAPWLRRHAIGVACGTALFLLACWLKQALLAAPVYGDENVHYAVALQFDGILRNTSTVLDDLPLQMPLFWQRPFYYVALHLPATLGFDAFRATQAALASLLAPLGMALVRAHGASRFTAVAAGVVLAVSPIFVVWGTLAFADVLMTAALLAFLLARHQRRWALSGALALVAVWTKETAYAAVLVLFAIDLVRAVRAGRASLYPLRLEAREASLAWAVLMGPLPLAWAITQGLLPPGGPAYGRLAQAVSLLVPTIWILPVLVAGLAFPRSRFLSAAGLTAIAAFLLYFMAGRSVESWYGVPTQALAVLGTASAADAIVRAARGSLAKAASLLPAAVALGACLAVAFVPAPAEGVDVLQPFGMPRATLAEAVTFQTTLRGQDLETVLAAIPLQEHPGVLLVQTEWPVPIVALAEASRVYVDRPDYRAAAAFGITPLAARIENATTWTVVGPDDLPMTRAIHDVYADCRVARHGGWTLYKGGACAGRVTDLVAANERHGGP